MSNISHKNLPVFIPHLACKNSCVFCNQKKIAGTLSPPSPDDVRELLRQGLATLKKPTQIAFFGGSFTGLAPEEMRGFLDAASPFVGENGYSGIRLSTRPDYITPEILALLKSYPVETIELGVQSLDDEVLKRSCRGHTADDVFAAVGLIRQYGFELVLQMMTGLPGSTPEKELATAEKIISLHPDGVRIYPTVVIKDTALYEDFLSGLYQPQTLEQAVDICARLLRLFEKAAIPVIRLGLHADSELTSTDSVAAGPFHPAFGELCRSRLYFDEITAALAGKAYQNIIIFCSKGEVSKVTGNKKCNLQKLKSLYGFQDIRVKEDCSLQSGKITVERS